VDAVADERLLHRFDDRNPPGDRGFEMDRRVELLRKGEQFPAAFGEQCLVAGDDRLFRPQGRRNDVEGVGCAADQFDDDVHRRIGDERAPVGGEKIRRSVADGTARLGRVTDENFPDVELHGAARTVGDKAAVAVQGVPNAGADGSESSQANAKGRASHGRSVGDRNRRAKELQQWAEESRLKLRPCAGFPLRASRSRDCRECCFPRVGGS
jgi:hypothetical protein